MRKFRPRTYFYLSVLISALALLLAALALWASLLGKTIDSANYLGTVPQWLTAIVAVFALTAAWVSIRSQREIARKRAALDFFVKTEMDQHILDAHGKYLAGAERLREFTGANGAIARFSEEHSQEYLNIRNYLNLHELMSVGISREVLDDHVCFFFWSGELAKCYRNTRQLIEHIQTLPDEAATYCEMVRVVERWNNRR